MLVSVWKAEYQHSFATGKVKLLDMVHFLPVQPNDRFLYIT